MSAVPKTLLTPQEYLALERDAKTKSEFLNGEMFAMAGASRWHVQIVGNIVTAANNALRGRDCRVYSNDMRVKVDETGMYAYPDVIVSSGEDEFEDDEFDILLNPTVIFEVLSDSTADFDRGGKFAHYRRLPSLRDYVLVTQRERHVEHHVRQQSGQWLLTELTEPVAVLRLDSVGCEISLADVYANVKSVRA